MAPRAYKIDRARGVDVVVEMFAPEVRAKSVPPTVLTPRGGEHNDCVTALELVLPGTEPMLVSGARDGVVKVWK